MTTIDEIRARWEHPGSFLRYARTDIAFLLAEINRLTAENYEMGIRINEVDQLLADRDNLTARNETLTQYANDCAHAMLHSPMAEENKALKARNAALEKVAALTESLYGHGAVRGG
jgi:hypothetical protein